MKEFASKIGFARVSEMAFAIHGVVKVLS